MSDAPMLKVWCEKCAGTGHDAFDSSVGIVRDTCHKCDGEGYISRPDPAEQVARMRGLLERVARVVRLDLQTCTIYQLTRDIEAELAKAKEEPRG